MMKFTNSLTAMIGDFANMNRTPDFKAKSESNENSSPPTQRTPAPGARRHSLNITVGAEALPQIPRRNRSDSICTSSTKVPAELMKTGRRSSAPAVSTSNGSIAFKSKLEKLKKKSEQSDQESDTIPEAEEEDILAKMYAREKRPSSYLL